MVTRVKGSVSPDASEVPYTDPDELPTTVEAALDSLLGATAPTDISGNAATATLASDSLLLEGQALAYVLDSSNHTGGAAAAPVFLPTPHTIVNNTSIPAWTTGNAGVGVGEFMIMVKFQVTNSGGDTINPTSSFWCRTNGSALDGSDALYGTGKNRTSITTSSELTATSGTLLLMTDANGDIQYKSDGLLHLQTVMSWQ